MEPDQQTDPRNRQLAIELILALVLFGLPIFLFYGYGDVENDEAIYSYAAEKIVETGEWLTPVGIYHGNPPFLEKPPLKFWLTALGPEMGLPLNNWGLRFADVVLTLLIFGYIVAIGHRVGGRWAGLVSGLTFFAFANPIISHGLLANNTESAVVLSYCGGMYHFMAWSDGARRRWLHILAIGLMFALGFMSKFVAALFLPASLAVVMVIHRELFRRFLTDFVLWMAAGAMVLVLVAPWFIYQHVRIGQVFWNVIFGEHVFERMTRFLDPEHLLPWYFYIWSTIRMVFESGAGLAYLIGLWFVLKALRSPDPKVTVLFAWYLVPVIAISGMTSKAGHYVYPFLPPVAVVCGFGLAHLSRLNLPAFGEYRIGNWVPRILVGLAAIPMQRLVLAVAVIPIVVVYAQTIFEIRDRPSQFQHLIACLQGHGVAPPLPAFFEPHRSANHVFTYYDLARDEGTDPQKLVRFLFGDQPEAAWLTESMYREWVVSDPQLRSIHTVWMPLAEFRSSEGEFEAVFLLLPERYHDCGTKLLSAGSTQVDPARYAN